MDAEYRQWAKDTEKKLMKKLESVAGRNRHRIPYTAVNGVYDDCSGDKIGWWTNGFFAGMMWQFYHVTGNVLGMKIAREIEEKLDANFLSYDQLDHDNGFKWLPTAVVDFKLTGFPKSENRALLAAANLAGRVNPAGKFIRAWNDRGGEDHRGYAIIDCMMNLPLLYWAAEHTKDPRFYQIAEGHGNTAMKNFVRSDGSVAHIVEFDPETGAFLKSHKGQGFDSGSAWTRGQGWGIYGFVLSWRYTENKAFLDTAKRIAGYFLEHIPADGLIPIDFGQQEDCKWEDSSAAAVAACGLLELAKWSEGQEKARYEEGAVKLLLALDEKRCDYSLETDNILEKCSASYKELVHEYPIIYGDYYFLEAVLKITGNELAIW